MKNYLVETANGKSSYQLARGFGDQLEKATDYFERLAVRVGQRKRLICVEGGKQTILKRG